MANKKISQLNPVVSLSNTDLFPVVQGAETKKAKIQDIKSYLPTATSAITGLLSYTDWTTFNNKQNALSFGNLTESTSSVLTITGGSSSVIGSGTSIQVKQASASQSGFLSSSDWSLFNSKLSALTLTTTGTSGPATLTGGNLLNIPQYLGAAITSINSDTTAAHTIQAASTGTDFAITTASGVTSIKLPTASASARGALSSTDWSTFNSKQNALSFGTLSETGSSVLTITGGTNSVVGGNVTINVTAASASTSGYLSSSNFTTFAGKQDAITLTTTGSSGPSTLIGNVLNIPQYGASISTGNLTESSSNILTITGGTNAVVGSGTTIAVKVANGSQDGYLKSSDWNTFNNKANSFTSGNLTESTSNVLTITGGTSAVIGSGVSITVAAANTSTDGYLKQSDWNTFYNKQAGSSNLTSLSGLSYASSSFVKMTGANTFSLDTNTYLTGNQSISFTPAVGGDVTGSATGSTSLTPTLSIGSNKVTNSMLAQVAASTIHGRVTAGTGNVENLTGTQATTLLDTFTSSLKGLAPASGGGTTNFLRADGTWAAPSGGGGSSTALDQQAGFSALGGSMKGINLSNINITYSTTQTLSNGLCYLNAIYLPTASTITGVTWYQAVNGSITANNYNGVALYSYSGGTMTLVASSTNDGAIWSQGTGWRLKAFSSTYSASAGIYFIASYSSFSASTTQPVMAAHTITPASNYMTMDFTNSARLVGSRTSVSSLLSSISMSSLNATSNSPTIMIY